MYSALTDDVIEFILHVCKTRKILMAILHRNGLLCDKSLSRVHFILTVRKISARSITYLLTDDQKTCKSTDRQAIAQNVSQIQLKTMSKQTGKQNMGG